MISVGVAGDLNLLETFGVDWLCEPEGKSSGGQLDLVNGKKIGSLLLEANSDEALPSSPGKVGLSDPEGSIRSEG